LTKALEELAHSGFIGAYKPFGKIKRETVYRLIDEYSLFYLRICPSARHRHRHVHLRRIIAQKYAWVFARKFPEIADKMRLVGWRIGDKAPILALNFKIKIKRAMMLEISLQLY
jgi:hypothetical protein